MADREDSRSLGELFADLARETSTLVRQELRQAGIEVGQRLGGVGREAVLLVGGALIAHAALLSLAAAMILVLGELGLPWWLAALIVAVVLAGIGVVLIQQARTALKRADILPRRTMEHVKEDQEWLSQQIR